MEDCHEEREECEEIEDEDLERCDEIPDEDLEREVREEALEREIDSLGVEWTEDIRRIEDLDLKEEEIENAKEIEEKEKELHAEWEAGEVTEDDYVRAVEEGLMVEKRCAITRCVIKAAGLNLDGTIFDDWDTAEPGSLDVARKRERLRLTIDSVGPELVQDLADRFQREGKISENTHEAVSEQVKLTGK